MYNETITEISEKNKPSDCDSDQSVTLAGEELEMSVGARRENADETAPITKSIEDAVVDELNKRHAAIHITQSYILTEKPNKNFPLQVDWFLETKESFLQQYENTAIMCGDGKVRTKGKIWLTHPRRRTYDNVTFNMTTTEHKSGIYNIWKGFSVKPKQGSCELYKAHIRENICCGDIEKYNYVLKWMANLVQRPNDIGIALLLMGSQGTGKGVFVSILGRLFGKHFIQLDNLAHVVGNFNNHMKDSVLVFCDEAIWGGNKKDLGRLKSMITEKAKIIEQKCKDPIPTENFGHFIFASNEDWPVHADRDDRRFLPLKVGEKHKEDHEYFKAIEQEMQAGGYEALLYELQNEDISNFCLQKIPQTPEAFSIKLLSSSSADQYLYAALSLGAFDVANMSTVEGWPNSISTNRVRSDYKNWCQQEELDAENSTQFGIRLRKLLPSVEKKQVRKNSSRQYEYLLPNLEETRSEFQKSFKSGNEIWT